MLTPPLLAVIWDFDNTLVDTRARNRAVTRRIIRSVTGRDPDEFLALQSQVEYDLAIHRTQNWRDLYRIHFDLAPDLVEEAGRLWTGFQLDDPTPITWFEGIPDVIRALGAWPQAIVSMNTRGNIEAALHAAELDHAFELVVGCEEVDNGRQKPDPEGLLLCLERLTGLAAGTALYIGDHPVDAECAANANVELEARGARLRVVGVGVTYGSAAGHDAWPVEPHLRVDRPQSLLSLAGVARRSSLGSASDLEPST